LDQLTKIGTLLVGVGLIALALLGIAGYIVIPLVIGGARATGLATIAFAIASLAGGAGILLTRKSLWTWRGRPPRPLRLFPPWVWLTLTGLGLVGGATMQGRAGAPYLFPPFHVLTFAAWAGFLFSMIYPRLPGLTVREVTLQLTYGAFGATSLCGVFEVLLLLLLGLVFSAVSASMPAGRHWLERIVGMIEAPGMLNDPQQLAALLLTPPVAATLVGSLVIGVPFIEETLKSLGVVLMSGSASSRGRFLAWGMLCGLGFGLMESELNAALLGSGWMLNAAIRLLTTMLHLLTGGLVAGGWYYALRERHVWKLGVLFLLAFALHALWNGVAAMGLLATLLIEGV